MKLAEVPTSQLSTLKKVTTEDGTTYTVNNVVPGPLQGCGRCEGGMITMANVSNGGPAKLCMGLDNTWWLMPTIGAGKQCSEVDPNNIEVIVELSLPPE